MKAAIYNGPYEIEVGDRPDPKVQEPTDAVVRVVLGSVCGSDLWYYRGQSPHAQLPELTVESLGSVIRILEPFRVSRSMRRSGGVVLSRPAPLRRTGRCPVPSVSGRLPTNR